LGGVAFLYPLNSLLRNEFCAVTFSHEFFKVGFPSEAVVGSVPVCPMEGTIFVDIPFVRISFQGWRSSYPSSRYKSCSAWRPFLKADDAIQSSHPTIILKGFVGLLAQVVQVVWILLDRPVGGVLFGEDVITNTLHINASSALWRIMTLLKCFKWLSGSESPLKWINEGVKNRFGGAACSISTVKGVEFAWSISLRSASSKFPSVFKSRSWSFTSFSTRPPFGRPFAIPATKVDGAGTKMTGQDLLGLSTIALWAEAEVHARHGRRYYG
ncbi:unnamed protein product, partial [Prunus brigantina]